MLPYYSYESYSPGIVFSSEVADPHDEAYESQGGQVANADGRADNGFQTTG
jgi:hypothetical protein